MVTLGLFLVVLNALMLYLTSWLAGSFIGPFTISSFIDALLAAIIISVVGHGPSHGARPIGGRVASIPAPA